MYRIVTLLCYYFSSFDFDISQKCFARLHCYISGKINGRKLVFVTRPVLDLASSVVGYKAADHLAHV